LSATLGQTITRNPPGQYVKSGLPVNWEPCGPTTNGSIGSLFA
jgi:hypothetical protein